MARRNSAGTQLVAHLAQMGDRLLSGETLRGVTGGVALDKLFAAAAGLGIGLASLARLAAGLPLGIGRFVCVVRLVCLPLPRAHRLRRARSKSCP